MQNGMLLDPNTNLRGRPCNGGKKAGGVSEGRPYGFKHATGCERAQQPLWMRRGV